MDKYFCKDCRHLWASNNFMLCCPGCVAHRDQGWDPAALQKVYGPMLAAAGRAYFPALAREFPPPARLPYAIYHTDGVEEWLGTQDFLPGFVKQQSVFLNLYRDKSTHWEALDPVVQHWLQNNSMGVSSVRLRLDNRLRMRQSLITRW